MIPAQDYNPQAEGHLEFIVHRLQDFLFPVKKSSLPQACGAQSSGCLKKLESQRFEIYFARNRKTNKQNKKKMWRLN